MISIVDKSKCCGCSSCESICPKQCIKMKPDSEGFLYPVVDESHCVNCGLCERVCPILNFTEVEGNPSAIVVRNTDESIVGDSTSGGAFSAIAETLIKEQNAVVYGAGFNDSFEVCHKSANTVEGIAEFRGSKFVQSNMTGIYTDVRNTLEAGKCVLFSGTPCQIAGLKYFLRGKEYDQLYCIDVVCRGVPSPKLWTEYISWISNKYKSKVKKVKFRNKTYGYHSSTMLVEFENGFIYKKSGRIDPMMRLFTKEMCSRPSCSQCHFKTVQRISDLTLFDCKKYSQLTGMPDDDKGYTAILVQSKKGMELLERTSDKISEITVDRDKLIELCGVMITGRAKENHNRNRFFDELSKRPLDELAYDVCDVKKKDFLIESLKAFLYKTKLMDYARKIKPHEVIAINNVGDKE